MRSPLPSGWAWTSLGEIGILVRGVSYTKDEASKQPGRGLLPILRANNINGEVNFDDLVFVPTERVGDEQQVKSGDIVIAMSSGSKDLVGKAAIAMTDFDGGFGAFCSVFRSSEQLNRFFIGYFFQTQSYRQAVSSFSSGVNINNLRRQHIESISFPLPPLHEQHRIVKKIEALFSELDKGIEQLKTAQQQLNVYRQSVLKWAFEGRLTAEWRKSQISNHKSQITGKAAEPPGEHSIAESARTLLERIRQEREAQAKADGKKPKPIAPLTDKELDDLPKLPEGWVWVRPEEVVSPEKYSIGIGPFGSNLKVSDYTAEGVPLVFVKNITRNDFNVDQRFISMSKYEELVAHATKPLDILVAKMGDPPGACAIYPENSPPAIITADVLKFRVWGDFTNKMFFKYCIETDVIKRQLGLITRGVAQKKISTSRFRTISFPFTSLAEQHQIVQEIETRLSVCDKLEETITGGLLQSEALRQSILRRAFEGKLVLQDPRDEPAERLMERIRAERTRKEKENGSTKPTKRKRVKNVDADV